MKKPYYQDNHIKIYNKDCCSMSELPDESAQMVCCSPPYWGLRKYSGEQELIWGDKDCEHQWGKQLLTRKFSNYNEDFNERWGNPSGDRKQEVGTYQQHSQGNFCSLCGAWKGAYGLEPTPEMYIQHTIEILREIRRVLRKDGVVFWNIGDSYAGSGRGADAKWQNEKLSNESLEVKPDWGQTDLKPKDLCLIPFRVALEAQRDGWWVRSVIIWSKPNPMPESVTDRPTESHEYILMLTKSSKYYWDADAVREKQLQQSIDRMTRNHLTDYDPNYPTQGPQNLHFGQKLSQEEAEALGGRNIRSVWEFNEDDEQGDKVYKVSVGCPIHSPLLHPEILKTLQDGEPLDCLLSHTLDMYSRLVLVPSFSLTSKLYHTNGGVHLSNLGFHHHETECGQITENIGDNRMLSLCCPDGGHKYGRQKVSHTKHIQKSDGSLFCSSDYSRQSDELIATLRSKEIRKIVSLIATNDSVFLQIPHRIVRILQALGCICSYNYYTTSHFPLQDVWTFSTQPFKEAHFAVFPEKLPELCIKAATPEVGCCSKCGAPWSRIIKQDKATPRKVVSPHAAPPGQRAHSSYSHERYDEHAQIETLGWQPTCKCNADKVPSLVLDPFMGAGTTLWVAKKLNRQAVGYEISEEYCQLALDRNRQQVMV